MLYKYKSADASGLQQCWFEQQQDQVHKWITVYYLHGDYNK